MTGDPEAAKAPDQPNNPLHGVKLEEILEYLVEHVGWIEMNRRVEINCFFLQSERPVEPQIPSQE